MPYDLENRLVVGVASSALFDLTESDAFFVTQGEEAYRTYQNDPSTGLRVMRSIEAQGLAITRAVFTQGRSPYEYIEELSMSLFLSANEADVKGALERGLPAAMVLASVSVDEEDGGALRIAFDFDGVIADDGSEWCSRAPVGSMRFRRTRWPTTGFHCNVVRCGSFCATLT